MARKKSRSFLLFSLFYIYSARRPSTGMKCLHWKTTEGQPQGNRDSRNEDSLPLRGSWKLSCNLSPFTCVTSTKSACAGGQNHVGVKPNSLPLQRGAIFLTQKTPESPQRREEDIETNLPCSCTPDGSQCCALTVDSSPVEDKKQTTSVRRKKKQNLLQKT